jgi:DNA repair protein RadA/Sms
MKAKVKYVCNQCGAETSRWMGRCGQCGAWDSLEEIAVKDSGAGSQNRTPESLPTPMEDIGGGRRDETRIDLGMPEFNRVLGGGLTPGSVVLVAGDPGIGKSTLLLQAACRARTGSGKAWYITGEESLLQVKTRGDRMELPHSQALLWAQTDIDRITAAIRQEKPRMVIVDSIQTMHTAELAASPGSVSQVRETGGRLVSAAKQLDIPILIVGHVTKDGSVAGPRVLEHMVDAVLYFEGERHYQYRILRAYKNRFGSTFEMGVFEMTQNGLIEVPNPSQAFLAQRLANAPGSAVAACMEGTRPLLIEVQALISPSGYGQPRRMTAGADYNRVCLILAVLEKRIGLTLNNQDAYVNVAGGIRVQEPGMDLAVAAAVASSFKVRPCGNDLALMGEIGLSGELRGVPYIEKRLSEAAKLGFRRCLIPQNVKIQDPPPDLELCRADTLFAALDIALAQS